MTESGVNISAGQSDFSYTANGHVWKTDRHRSMRLGTDDSYALYDDLGRKVADIIVDIAEAGGVKQGSLSQNTAMTTLGV